jgi:hypothetical protein
MSACVASAGRHFSGDPAMFDAIWLALILGLFGVGLAYLAACDRV